MVRDAVKLREGVDGLAGRGNIRHTGGGAGCTTDDGWPVGVASNNLGELLGNGLGEKLRRVSGSVAEGKG